MIYQAPFARKDASSSIMISIWVHLLLLVEMLVSSTLGLICRPGARELRLRTKFLLSLVVVIAGLTCATLFVVRRGAQERARREVQEEALNAVLTFRVLQHDR
jgi:hypothetical protein